MPEFILDRGDSAPSFALLDTFTQAYIEAMFWAESGEPDGACYGASLSNLSADAWCQAKQDCADFQEAHSQELFGACSQTGYSIERAGHDFWLTRNRHGAGFWDRGLGEVGEQLSDYAKSFGTVGLYRGDDGMIYPT